MGECNRPTYGLIKQPLEGAPNRKYLFLHDCAEERMNLRDNNRSLVTSSAKVNDKGASQKSLYLHVYHLHRTVCLVIHTHTRERPCTDRRSMSSVHSTTVQKVAGT